MSGALGGFVDLVATLGLCALVSAIYGLILRHLPGCRLRGVVLGLLFGAAATYAMAQATVYGEGVRIDARNVLMLLAAPIAGQTAGLVACLLAGSMRLALGGQGMWIGVVSIVLSSGIAAAFAADVRRPRNGYSVLHFAGLGLAGCVTGLLLLALPANTAYAASFLPLCAVKLIGTTGFGWLLSRQKPALPLALDPRPAA
ncbi:LytS/YhcK type 5TM receptor domain-containing protein [Mangrovibrevibacter kandeliae]|uniref:LytS/YhcK type 5TM receptor domain-containing protein n=1 Tax=Mangrovibrevibacter kandeliae TaxID=2968473 RepID=UPI0021191ED6|nr:LytS/YhcK type 5TM receptor domain-containing protein [Aurantimonas sp. CSK15Z-1]MCQ8782063.1 hypothetical protein [Aurantimonas sp. CSK15Z-1]